MLKSHSEFPKIASRHSKKRVSSLKFVWIATVLLGLVLAVYYGLSERPLEDSPLPSSIPQQVAPSPSITVTFGQKNKENQAIIELTRGMSLNDLSAELARKKVIQHAPLLFSLWVKVFSNFRAYKAGKYLFEVPSNFQAVAEKMTAGDVYREITLQVSIPEGFTLKKIIRRLEAHHLGSLGKMSALVQDRAFLNSLRVSADSLEGYVFPATYSFEKAPTPEEFFRLAVQTFWERLPHQYEERLKGVGLTLQQAVIFASLIELETKHNEERSYVSEVIWHRLKDKMALGIDASIIYGIESYDGNLHVSDLKNEKNLYNTRIHKGLPPGPIGSVSTASLEAVLTPSNLGYYYYVLMYNCKGWHHFSKTFSEHHKFVNFLIKKITPPLPTAQAKCNHPL